MTIILIVSASLIIIIYSIFFTGYTRALRRFDSTSSNSELKEYPYLSLIIPVRNESQNLPEMFKHLSHQIYPDNSFEVLFINDHSEDKSIEILKRFCDQNKHSSFYNLPEFSKGKKAAIELGLKQARGEWIIQTDADCYLPPGFLRSHATYAADNELDFVAGPVKIISDGSLWNKIESLEFLSLAASGMASFLANRPALCNAANMSYRKTLYQSVRSYLPGTSSPSGDDVFLLSAAKSMKKKMGYISDLDAIVEAKPSGGFLNFLNQRIRWGSKAKQYRDKDQMVLTLLVWITNLVLSVLLCSIFFNSTLLIPFISVFLLKAIVDFVFLWRAATLLNQRSELRYFPLLLLFYYFYISVTGLLSLVGRFRWKQRNYETKPARH